MKAKILLSTITEDDSQVITQCDLIDHRSNYYFTNDNGKVERLELNQDIHIKRVDNKPFLCAFVKDGQGFECNYIYIVDGQMNLFLARHEKITTPLSMFSIR